MVKESKRPVVLAAIIVISILTIGTLGYIIIEGFTFTEAVYMTIITIATVGFKEVRDLSNPGMWFTISLILLSLGLLTFALSHIASHFGQVIVSNLKSNRKVEKKISTIKEHAIVVGYGRNGQQAVEELLSNKIPVVVIENKPENIQVLETIPNLLYILGDATDEEVLKTARIEYARALISSLPNDADNLFVVVTARVLSPNLKIISRASTVGNDKKLKLVGATNVIMPDKVGGQRMATLVVQPDLSEFLEKIMLSSGSEVSLVELSCSAIERTSYTCTIGNLRIRELSGVSILGLKNADNQYVLNPTADTTLSPEDMLFVLGTPLQINALKLLLSGTHPEGQTEN
ncbi:MAG: potassium channel protein [Perlabentimonas sp.]